VEYNLNFFSIMIRLLFISFFFFISSDNFGLDLKYSFFKFLLTIILTLIRITLLGYLLSVLIIDYFILLIDTSRINNKNWWRSRDEPFITNASMINAAITWIVWYINLIVYAACLYMTVFFVFAGFVILMT